MFHKKAIVCVPTPEEMKRRNEERKKNGIELPDNAISDMKCKSAEKLARADVKMVLFILSRINTSLKNFHLVHLGQLGCLSCFSGTDFWDLQIIIDIVD